MTRLLLNCDLGEWETTTTASGLIRQVDLINIACGGHAGSAEQIRFCKKEAEQAGIRAGAHPGTKGNRGRFTGKISVADFTSLLEEQLTFYRQYAGEPSHIKLHGSLYHLSENDEALRRHYLKFCEEEQLPIIALNHGHVVRDAATRQLPVLREAFLDRATLPNGQLVPRSEPNALITDPDIILTHLPHIQADTACIHSDSPNSLQIITRIREALR